jgi:NhaP-type Na+/H+ or K+/H+ antiporter
MTDIAILAIVVAAAMLVSVWLSEHWISMPIVFVAVGLLLGPDGVGWLDLSPTAEIAESITELTLGLLLFADASTLPARRVTRERSLESRLLGLGLPMSIALGALIAYLVFPDEEIGLVLLLGAALAPDGIATPFVTLFISLAVAEGTGREGGWLRDAAGDIAIAVAAGAAVGLVGGRLLAVARRRGWCAAEPAQVAFLAFAAAAFFGAQALGGNGFIASAASRWARRRSTRRNSPRLPERRCLTPSGSCLAPRSSHSR